MSTLSIKRKTVLSKFLSAQTVNILLLTISSVIISIGLPFLGYFVGGFIDFLILFDSQIETTLSDLYNVGIYLPIVAVLIIAISRFKAIISSVVYNKIASDSLLGAFEHVQQNSHMYFTDNDPDDISSEITYFSKITVRTLATILDHIIPLICMVLSSLFLLLYVDTYLLNTLISSVICLCLTALFFSKIAPDNVLKEDKLEEDLDYKIYDTLDNHLSVMLNHSYDAERQKVAESVATMNASKTKSMIKNEFIVSIVSAVCVLFFTVTFFKILQHWFTDKLTIGQGIAAISLASMMFFGMYRLNELAMRLAINLFDLKESLNFIREPEQVKNAKTSKRLRIRRGKIEFRKVSFTYQFNDNMFIEKSLTIDAKQRVCLVGLSGSGKTTFAYLIPKIYPITSGRIEIDGQDISKVSLKSLRENICFVGEDTPLFNGSFKENIKYGCPDATDDDVIEAASIANCHDTIINLENGYETQYNEDFDLSATLQLKIQIARALLKDAPIVIVDEKVISLDSNSEKQIQDSIKALCKNKTSIIIARRAETAKNCDRIFVFNKGTIVEDGAHSELLKLEEHYSNLWEMQANGFLPDNIEE